MEKIAVYGSGTIGSCEATREITKKHIGMTAVVDNDNKVLGIFTEGDLRRLIEQRGEFQAEELCLDIALAEHL